MLAPYDEELEVEPYIENKKKIIEKSKKMERRFLKEQKEGKKLSGWELKYINAQKMKNYTKQK